jgi:hypothetical protein
MVVLDFMFSSACVPPKSVAHTGTSLYPWNVREHFRPVVVTPDGVTGDITIVKRIETASKRFV